MWVWIFDLLSFWLNRRVVLWVESVPTPAKSKILSEIKVRMGHFFSFCYQLLHIWVVVIWLNHEFMFSSLHTPGRWCKVRPCLCAKCTSWTVYQHGTSLLSPSPPCFQTDYNQNKFLWGVSERIMDNFPLSRKSHSLLRVSLAALRTSRFGKTRAAKESVWIGTRAAGSAITTRPLLRVKAAPSKCPP